MPGLLLLNELSPNVIVALIGAGATLIAALINLRIASRREVLDRLQRSRSTARGRSGFARFAGQLLERAESASTRQVCLDVWSWDSQRALDARLLVKYVPAERAAPVPAAVAR